MSVWAAVFLGLLQGITEFLPVSSSGHLVLAQRIMGISGGTVLFDVVVHLGTLVAVCVCFWRDIWALVKHPWRKEMGMLIVATVPAVAVSLLFGNFIENSFGGDYLGWGFLVTAAMLLAVSGFGRRKVVSPSAQSNDAVTATTETVSDKIRKAEGEVNFKTAIVMGIAEAVAMLPGISRSGATISGGLVMGADRERAARFSFLMSFPAILGAAVYELTKLGAVTQSVAPLPLILGFIVAAAAGTVAVKFMLNIIKKAKFWPFSAYLVLLGAFVLVNQYVGHWF